MVWAEVAGVAGAAAGAAEGRAGAWRTRVCAVAQVATQCSWPLVWAWIRPSVPSWAITRTEIPRSVTVQCLLGKNYNCWRGGSGLTIRRRLTICPTKAPGCLTELGGRGASSIPVIRRVARFAGFATRSTPQCSDRQGELIPLKHAGWDLFVAVHFGR